MELVHLLQPLSDESPSGDNLEYDPAFTALELAAQPGEERQVGDSIIHASDPDFKEVIELAMAVLTRSHDLRAAVTLAYARLRLHGLTGFAEVTAYIRGLLETYWDSCHPPLDADDDDDPTMRVNAVLRLADAATVLRGLRLTPLTDSRAFGRINLRDIAVAEGEMVASADMDTVHDAAAISAAFLDTDPERLKLLLLAAKSALDDVRAIDARFDDRIPGQGPELEPLVKLLKQIQTRLTTVVGVPEEAQETAGDPSDAAVTAEAGFSGASARGPAGSISSRADVTNTLDRILAYYERHEPSSPLPLLLLRSKRLVGADFMTIMRDIAPLGIENVNLVAGIDDDDD